MAYEKADFFTAYSSYPRVSETDRTRFAGYRNPSLEGLVDYDPVSGIKLNLHYHPHIYRQQASLKAARLITYLVDQGTPLTGTDSIIVVGGAFGWLGEALQAQVPGLEALSIDLSQYVQDTKDISPDDELIESIQASGYDHTLPNSVGEYLFNIFTDPAPRATVTVLQEDLVSNKSRNTVKKALSRVPTRVITEEVWQILSQTEKDQYTAAAASFIVPMTHIIDGVII